jgi:hypothetical protein
MNAKKLLSVLVLASAGLGLVACGTASSSKAADSASASASASNTAQPAATTRAQALTALDKIAANVTAASFVKPTTAKAVAPTKTTEYDEAHVFAHTTYTADVKDKTGAVTTASGTEIWAYKGTDNKFYVVEKAGTTISNWSADADFGVVSAVAKGVSGANGLGSAAYMAKYLRNFADGATGLVTGATVKAGAYMKAETYTIASEGNVILDITPNYGYDEHMVYTYKDNKIATIDKSGLTTFTFAATVAVTLPTDTGTAVADAIAGAALLKLL